MDTQQTNVIDVNTEINVDIPTRNTSVIPVTFEQEDSGAQQDTTVTDLVILQNDQAITTSLKVAEVFGKNHKHVLDSIREILAAEKSATKFFEEGTFNNRGKPYPMYYMNRDGFTLLAMGFTGSKALQFKLAYIDAFNKMEAKLKEQQSNMTPAEQFMMVAKIQLEHERRLRQHNQQISKNTADIQSLLAAHNGIAFRHELKNISQQKQLDRHEGQISSLNQDMTDIKNVLVPEFSNVDKKQAAILAKRVYLLAGNKSEISCTWDKIQGIFVENLQIDIAIETSRAQEFLTQYYYQAKINGNPPSSVLRPAEIKNLSFNQLVTMKSEWYYEVLDIIKFYETEKIKGNSEGDV